MSQNNNNGPDGGPPPREPAPPPLPQGQHPNYPPGARQPLPQKAPPPSDAGQVPINIGNNTYMLAGYLNRVIASLIDGVILNVPMAALMFFSMFLMMITIPMAAGGSGNVDDSSIFPVVFFFLMYGFIFLSIFGLSIWYWCFFLTQQKWGTKVGQTFGCKIMNIRIIKQDGSNVRPWDGFLRLIGYVIGGWAMYLGYIWVFIDDYNRGWHDMIATTYVIND